MSTLIVFAVVLAVLLPLLIRDLERADQRRRLRAQPEYRNIKRAFETMQLAVGAAILPVAVKAAADMERSMRKVQATMKVNPDALAALKRMAEGTRHDGP